MERRILYLQYTNPAGYPPLEHSSRILATGGWQVRFMGTGAQGEADQFQFPEHSNIEVCQWEFCRAGVRQKIHYIVFGLWVAWAVWRWKPQWVYASDLLSCPIALGLSFIPGVRVLYHEHDSPALASQSWLLSARKILVRRISLCVLPSERRAEAFKSSTGTTRPVLCVWNCPDGEEAISDSEERKADGFILFYHGSIVPSRVPFSVLAAMSELPQITSLRICGYETVGHFGYLDRLRAEAERLELGGRVEYLGALSQRAEVLKHCRKAHLGLSLMPMASCDINEQNMAGSSNKPFDYLACGLPLLVSDLPDWNKMFLAPGYARACNPTEPASITGALRWFAENLEQTRDMGARGKQRILKDWNYQRQFAPVLDELERTIPAE